ncbi:MAG: 3-dehydroquinate synthase [Rhodospirillales bacterium]
MTNREPDSKDQPQRLEVALASRAYSILVGGGILAGAGRLMAPLLAQPRTVVVTDANVAPLYLEALETALGEAGIEHAAIVLDPGEGTKDFGHLEDLCGRLLEIKVERRTTLVALGGGMVGDITGLAAAITLRGLPLVQVPTTLLAQVDSSVGGKTGINTPFGKNLIGSFHQPVLVLADIDVLVSLPRRELLAGYAEVVKYGLIGDKGFFSWLEENSKSLLDGDQAARRHAVLTSCAAKAAIVAEDELEAGKRALLNLGHTFGHALEAETGYSDALAHGEAVAIGMCLAFELSARMGLCPGDDAGRVRRHLESSGLPTRVGDVASSSWSADALIAHMQMDKKVRDGRMTFVLARGIGKSFITGDVAMDDVRQLLEDALGA